MSKRIRLCPGNMIDVKPCDICGHDIRRTDENNFSWPRIKRHPQCKKVAARATALRYEKRQKKKRALERKCRENNVHHRSGHNMKCGDILRMMR